MFKCSRIRRHDDWWWKESNTWSPGDDKKDKMMTELATDKRKQTKAIQWQERIRYTTSCYQVGGVMDELQRAGWDMYFVLAAKLQSPRNFWAKFSRLSASSGCKSLIFTCCINPGNCLRIWSTEVINRYVLERLNLHVKNAYQAASRRRHSALSGTVCVLGKPNWGWPVQIDLCFR